MKQCSGVTLQMNDYIHGFGCHMLPLQCLEIHFLSLGGVFVP